MSKRVLPSWKTANDSAVMLEKGLHKMEVAKRAGASREAVRRWDNLRKEKGFLGLKKAGRGGRKPSLQPKQQEKIIAGPSLSNKM
jgi:transposase